MNGGGMRHAFRAGWFLRVGNLQPALLAVMTAERAGLDGALSLDQ